MDRPNTGVGGSDAPTILGLDEYKTALELYLEKRGELEPNDLSDNMAVRAGQIYEAPTAEWWSELEGKKIRRVNKTVYHPDNHHIYAHVDRRIVGERAGLEVKFRHGAMASKYGPDGTDQVLDTDIVQCQHYMSVFDWTHMYMAVHLGGGDLRRFIIPRDQPLIDAIFEEESLFMLGVTAGTPPALDFDNRATGDALRRIYPGTNGETVILDNEALHWKAVRDEAAAAAKMYEAIVKGADNHIRMMMGEHAKALLPDGSGGWTRKIVKRKGYEVEPSEHLDFRFSKRTTAE